VAISQFLDDLRSSSDASSDSSAEEDNPEDIDYLVHMRYRGIETLPQPGLGMFRDLYKGAEFGEDGGDEVGGDGDVSCELEMSRLDTTRFEMTRLRATMSEMIRLENLVTMRFCLTWTH
jgi:hypothetical protein